MADRGIIFSAPMVRALLAGTKTQTRRLLNPQPETFSVDEAGTPCDVSCIHVEGEALPRIAMGSNGCGVITLQKVPHAAGDRLYVREAAWIAPPAWTDSPQNPMGPQRQEVAYAADDRSGYTADAAKDYKLRLRPSIHMPRWASRLTLLVTDVRVQRLQDISEEDCIAEGIEARGMGSIWGWIDYLETNPNLTRHFADPCRSYASLWNSLHTEPGTRWEDNPWIYAITFDVRHGNIDAVAS